MEDRELEILDLGEASEETKGPPGQQPEPPDTEQP